MQVAERQGRYLAELLNNTDQSSVKPFTHKHLGMLAYIGGYEALTDTPDVKLKGTSSTHSVGYLVGYLAGYRVLQMSNLEVF